MNWYVTTPPAALPIEFSDFAKHIRIDASDRNYVMKLQRSAVAHAERYLDQSLMARTITATFDRADAGHDCYDVHRQVEIELPRGPVSEVVSVKDANDTSITYTRHRVGNSDRIRFGYQTAYPITVVYTAGYATADAIPADIINAIRLHTATLYSWREDVSAAAANSVYNLDRFYSFAGSNTGVG